MISRFPVARASIQAVISKPCMGPHMRAFSTRTSRVPRRTVSGSDIDTPYRFCIEWVGVGLVSRTDYADRFCAPAGLGVKQTLFVSGDAAETARYYRIQLC